MQGKILGGYNFQSKNGKSLTNLSIVEDRLNGVGVCTTNIMTLSDNLPAKLDDMINKIYIIDCRFGSSGAPFAQAFYPIK